MKLFAIFWFTHLILVDNTLCERNNEGIIDNGEQLSEHLYNDYPTFNTPLIKSMTFQNIMRRIKQPEFNLRSDCFFADDNNPNCGFASNEFRQKNVKIEKNNLDSSLINLLKAKEKLFMTKSKQQELFEPDINDTNLKNDQQGSLTAEEPRFVIIRKEKDFPMKLDSRNFWEFIPPRGRKGHFDLNDDMFMPNRGKKGTLEMRDKKAPSSKVSFELQDDFYPVRGRRLADIVQRNGQQAAYDEDLFYPNRGKRSFKKITHAIAEKLNEK